MNPKIICGPYMNPNPGDLKSHNSWFFGIQKATVLCFFEYRKPQSWFFQNTKATVPGLFFENKKPQYSSFSEFVFSGRKIFVPNVHKKPNFLLFLQVSSFKLPWA